MSVFIVIIILILSAVSCFYLGHDLSIMLPEVNKWLDRKPFNCRPCLTFHLTWILVVSISFIIKCMYLVFLGVLTAFILFMIVWYIDNKKVIK